MLCRRRWRNEFAAIIGVSSCAIRVRAAGLTNLSRLNMPFSARSWRQRWTMARLVAVSRSRNWMSVQIEDSGSINSQYVPLQKKF